MNRICLYVKEISTLKSFCNKTFRPPTPLDQICEVCKFVDHLTAGILLDNVQPIKSCSDSLADTRRIHAAFLSNFHFFLAHQVPHFKNVKDKM